jgi:uncharacterized protein YkwD
MRNTGYLAGTLSRWAYGENIGWGLKRSGTPRQMVNAWMKSAPHRAAILSTLYHDFGVGFVEGTPKRKRAHGGIYTVDFGLRVG